MLGKRKRRASLEEEVVDSSQVTRQQAYQELLQRHFESAYEPLDEYAVKPAEDDSPSSDSAGDDDWEGISGDNEEGADKPTNEAVEIIDHSNHARDDDDTEAIAARKAFMTSKLPSDAAIQALRKVTTAQQTEDSASEASLVKNDLALQRLLRESKLLSSAGDNGTIDTLQLSGKTRHKALDARIQALGAKTSVEAQKSMPRAQRVGIIKKATEKEALRRSEAREAGVVLEKERRRPSNNTRRERGVGAPGVGKFRGGTLTLSARDVRSIQGRARTGSKGKRGKR